MIVEEKGHIGTDAGVVDDRQCLSEIDLYFF